MERLTTNKSVADMSMIELAHNSCYADDERNARYRDYEMEMDARDFARNLMVTLAKDELPVDDAEFDEEILDNLTIDPFSDVRGLIALFYRNMWAMADLREKLKYYEDAEEHGLLLRLPCKVGDKVYQISENFIEPCTVETIFLGNYRDRSGNWCNMAEIHYDRDDCPYVSTEIYFTDIGETVFFTETEAKLKEMEHITNKELTIRQIGEFCTNTLCKKCPVAKWNEESEEATWKD